MRLFNSSLIALFLVICSSLGSQIWAQNSVSIGTTSTNPKAVLWLSSSGSNQGLIVPIVSNKSVVAATSTEKGMIVFDDSDKKVYFFDGSAWNLAGGSIGTGSQGISINGNLVQIGTGSGFNTSFPLSSPAPNGLTDKGSLFAWDGTKWSITPKPATTGQILKWDNSTGAWVLGTESQALSLTGTTLSITGGNSVTLPTGAGVSSVTASSPLINNGSATIPNIAISPGTINGQVLQWNGTAWNPAAVVTSVSANAPLASSGGATPAISFTGWPANAVGTLTNNGSGSLSWQPSSVTSLGGDLSGTLSSATVQGIRGISVSAIPPSLNQVLQYNGTAWTPTNVAAGGVSSVTANSPLASSGGATPAISFTGWPANAVGTLTNNGSGILSWGSSLTNPMNAAGDIIYGGATGVATKLAAGTGFLRGGSTPSYSSINLNSGDVSGTLPVTSGGTGRTTWNGIVYGSGATLSDISTGTAGTLFISSGIATTPNWQAMSGDATITATGVLSIANTATTGNNLITSINSASPGVINGARVNPSFGAQAISSGASGQFAVNNTGNITKINNLTTSFPSVQAAGVLTNDGTGTLTWAAGGASLLNNTGTNNLFGGTSVSTSGTDNAIYGANAGSTNTGNFNVIMGAQAAQSKTSGDLNTIIGWFAGKLATNAGNTLIGAQAGENTTGSTNTFLGEKAGQGNTIGSQNVFIGNTAGTSNTSGAQNTIIGYGANVGSGGLINANAIGNKSFATQSNSLILGSISGVNGATASTNVGIGTSAPLLPMQVNSDLSNSPANSGTTAVGAFRVAASDSPLTIEMGIEDNVEFFGWLQVHQGNNQSINAPLVVNKNGGNMGIGRTPLANNLEISGNASKAAAGGWIVNSDRRIKTDIQDINGLVILKKIRPVKYRYTAEWLRRNPSIKDHYYYSFIAQEYQQVFPEAVKGSGEYLQGDKEEILQIDTHNAQMVTIKAVQEQQKIIEAQQEEIAGLKKELSEIKNYLGMEAKASKKKKNKR